MSESSGFCRPMVESRGLRMIFDVDMNIVAGAAKRWQERAAIREGRRDKPVTEIEDPKRIQARLDRLAEAAKPGAALQFAGEAIPFQSDVLRLMGLERTIAQSDFQ